MPPTAPTSRSAGFGVPAGVACAYLLGGAVTAAICYLVCHLAIAVARCEGDPATRRQQARKVAIAGAVAGIVVVAIGVLVVRALGQPPALFPRFGMAGRSDPRRGGQFSW